MAGIAMVDTELAWELADTARGHLDARQRDQVYIGIAADDGFFAVAFLLQTIVRAGLAVRADLAPKLVRWVASYDDHPKQAQLRHLIGRLRIQPSSPHRNASALPMGSAAAASTTAAAHISSATIAVQQPGLATLSARRPRATRNGAVATSDERRR
jgi:hypothetical protein